MYIRLSNGIASNNYYETRFSSSTNTYKYNSGQQQPIRSQFKVIVPLNYIKDMLNNP